jgi:hypothetical protein
VDKDEFTAWFHSQLTNLVGTPFDVLYGTNTATSYWWFMEVLWMKTGINMLYTFGIFGAIPNWHIWMHVSAAAAVSLWCHQGCVVVGGRGAGFADTHGAAPCRYCWRSRSSCS